MISDELLKEQLFHLIKFSIQDKGKIISFLSNHSIAEFFRSHRELKLSSDANQKIEALMVLAE